MEILEIIYLFKYRIHDARLGRFLSVDPLAPDYPWNSPYAFSENNVIAFFELEGLEKYVGTNGQKYGQVTNGKAEEEANQVRYIAYAPRGDITEEEITENIEHEINLAQNGSVQADQNLLSVSYEYMGPVAIDLTQYYLYPGQARMTMGVSNINLWVDLNHDYNSASGYSYTLEDLRLRYLYRQLDNYSIGVGVWDWIKVGEKYGKATPTSSATSNSYFGPEMETVIKPQAAMVDGLGFACAGGIGRLPNPRGCTTFSLGQSRFNGFTKLGQGITKPSANSAGTESTNSINFNDPKSFTQFRGASHGSVRASLIKNGWSPKATNANKVYNNGVRFKLSGGNDSHAIRIMTGGPARSLPNKLGPYLEVNGGPYRGFEVPLEGNPILIPNAYP